MLHSYSASLRFVHPGGSLILAYDVSCLLIRAQAACDVGLEFNVVLLISNWIL